MDLDFNQAVTLAALLLGPAGIVLGWLLSQRSEANRDARAADSHQDREQRERVIAVVDISQRIVSDLRSLVVAEVLAYNKRPPHAEQHRQVADEFNASRSQLGRLAAETAILGPEWSVEYVDRVLEGLSEGHDHLTTIQWRLDAKDVDAAKAHFETIEASIDDLVAEAKRRYA